MPANTLPAVLKHSIRGSRYGDMKVLEAKGKADWIVEELDRCQIRNGGEWAEWLPGYRTVNQERGIRFIPLYEVEDQAYTVYFPVKS